MKAMSSDYWETESFWEKLHEQRVKNGDIIGWDLWALSPSGTSQGHQYMTVTIFNDPVKMMQGGDFNKTMEGAYPNMSQVDRDKKMDTNLKKPRSGRGVFLYQIAAAGDNFEMPSRHNCAESIL